MYIAFDVTGRLQHHLSASDRAHNVTTHNDLFSIYTARNAGSLADDDMRSVKIPLHFAVDLDFTGRNQIAHDGQIGTDN